MSILIDKIIHPFGEPQRLEVSSPTGVGGLSYHVYLDNYFLGSVVYYTTGWAVALQNEGSLPKEYCDAIVEKVKQVKFGL